MSDSFKSQIESLVKLQTIEMEANSIRALTDRLPEKISALDSELKTFQQDVEQETALAEELGKKYRDQEREVQENMSRLKKSQAKLTFV